MSTTGEDRGAEEELAPESPSGQEAPATPTPLPPEPEAESSAGLTPPKVQSKAKAKAKTKAKAKASGDMRKRVEDILDKGTLNEKSRH